MEAVIKRLEEKLGSQRQVQLQNSLLFDKRNQLGDLNYQIATLETVGSSDPYNAQRLANLRKLSDQLKNDIRLSATQLSASGTTTEGLPVSTILKDWIDNVVESESLKASIGVLSQRIKEQQKEYSEFAPAGSEIKKIEREISVTEQRYLDILHSLDQAKIKMQDNELSSNIKIFDEPYFPLSPIPTKRKIMIVLAAMIGLMIVLTYIFLLEILDNSIKNQSTATVIIKQPVIGVIPKILPGKSYKKLPFMVNRLFDVMVQYIEMYLKEKNTSNKTKTLLFFSTLQTEGKSVVIANLAQKFGDQGKKVLVLCYDHDLLRNIKAMENGNVDQTGLSTSQPTEQKKSSSQNVNIGSPSMLIGNGKTLLTETKDEFRKFELIRFAVNGNFLSASNYQDILSQNSYTLTYTPDLVLIELPPIMYNSYPVALLTNSDLSILVCRSNRTWTEADQGALDRFTKFTDNKAYIVLNGVDISVVESVLGKFSDQTS